MLVITASGSTIEGQTYSLTCDLMGDESLDVTEANRRVRWDKVGEQHGINRTATLSFNPLSRDDEGEYRCTTSIRSPYAIRTLTEIVTTSFTVFRMHKNASNFIQTQ